MVARVVIDQLVDLGWSEAQATGIAANIQAESNFNAEAVGDGGKAYGIAQWHPDRQAQFEVAFGKPIKGSTLEEQVAFIDYEMRHGNERRAGQKLMETDDAAQAARIVSKFYERPFDKEGQAAKRAQLAASMAGTSMATTGSDDLTALTAQGEQVTARLNVAAQALEDMFSKQIDFIGAQKELIQGSIEDAQLVQRTQDLAEAKAQSAAYDFAKAAGAVPGVANEALYKLMEKSNNLAEKQRSVAARLENAADPRQLYRNPGRYLADYLLAPFNEQRLKAIDSQLDSTRKQISNINSSTQQYKQTQDAIAQTKTVASAQANARLVAQKAQMDLAKLDIDALRTNADGIMKVTQMRNSVWDRSVQMYNFKQQGAMLEMQRQDAAARSEELQLRLKDRKTADEAKQAFLEYVNAGAAYAGTAQFKSYEQLMMLTQANPAYKDVIATNYQTGYATLSGGIPTISSSPVGLLDFQVVGGARLPDGPAALADKIKTVMSDLPAERTTVNGRPSISATNAAIVKEAQEHLKDITKGDNNFYRPPEIEALLQDEEFAKTHFATKILENFKGQDIKVAYTKAISMLFEDLKRGVIPLDVADSELGFMADKIRGYNEEHFRYQASAGLPGMTSVVLPVEVPRTDWMARAATMYGYGIQAQMGDFSQSPTPTELARVDISDPSKRASLLNKVLATSFKVEIKPAESKVD